MKRMRLLGLAALVAGGFLFGGAQSASAVPVVSATYLPITQFYGSMTITGPSFSQYAVWAEQPNGPYVQVANSQLPFLGLVTMLVPDAGPKGNNRPQFYVTVFTGSGPITMTIDDPGERWWLD